MDDLKLAAVKLAVAVTQTHGLDMELYDLADEVRIAANALIVENSPELRTALTQESGQYWDKDWKE